MSTFPNSLKLFNDGMALLGAFVDEVAVKRELAD